MNDSSGGRQPKKTRTIVVARSLSGGGASAPEATVTSTIPESNGPSASAVGASPHRVRDEQSGKLISYAALGGEEDLDRFDRFLADQGRGPSSSDFTSGSSSPSSKLAKRQSMTRVKDGVGSQQSTSNGENEARPKPPAESQQQEAAMDARKRREAAVARRRMLQALPIHERLAHERQQTVLKRWHQINAQWERFKARTAKKLGKPETQLVMSRASAYREQVEMYDALQKARPMVEKVGNDVWLVSLRDEGTRFVPVGNIFSGLYCPIRESSRVGPQVRRPLDYHLKRAGEKSGLPTGDDEDTTKSASAVVPLSMMEKRSLELLERKKRRLRKRLEELLPHEVSASSKGQLVVETLDLFEWASESSLAEEAGNNHKAPPTPLLAELGSDTKENSMSDNNDATAGYDDDNGGGASPSEIKGPCLRVFSADSDIESDFAISSIPIGNASHHQRSTGDGEAQSAPAIRLSFFSPIREQQQRQVAIENAGTTVVHFQWWRAPFLDAKLSGHLNVAENSSGGHHTVTVRDGGNAPAVIVMTSVSTMEGSLLPGETQVFTFSFEAVEAGTFLEKWMLSTDPAPRVLFGRDDEPKHDKSRRFIVEDDHVPVTVHLKCTAVDNCAPWKKRQKSRDVVKDREVKFFVRELVEEMLRNVQPQEKTVFVELSPADRAAQFNCDHDASDFRDVFYSPELLASLSELYGHARQIVEASSVAAEVISTGFITESAEATANSETPTGVEISTSDETAERELLPTEWNGMMESVRDVCRRADVVRYLKIADLTQSLRDEKKRLAEEADNEEEEEENDDDEEEEDEDSDNDDDDDDDDEEDDDDDDDEEATPLAKPKKETKAERLARRAAERQQVKQVREDRCQELSKEIEGLQPRLQDAFLSVRFSAATAPYSTAHLQAFMSERLLHFVSETPVVCEIANPQPVSSGGTGPGSGRQLQLPRQHQLEPARPDHGAAKAAALSSVRELVTRVVDEAVGLDMERQANFERERRQFGRIWLPNKVTTAEKALSVSTVRSRASSTAMEANELVIAGDEESTAPVTGLERSQPVPLLMYVDLDVAPWFELVKTTDFGADGPTTAHAIDDMLHWQLDRKLITHSTFVPSKIASCASSFQQVLTEAKSGGGKTDAVVLVSELSAPPVTKAALKLLRNVKAQMNASVSVGAGTNAPQSPRRLEDSAEQIMQRLRSRISLRDIAPLLQRALGSTADVVFCSSLCELDDKLHEMQASEASLDMEAAAGDGTVEGSTESTYQSELSNATDTPTRVLLLDHIGALVEASTMSSSAPSGSARLLAISATAPAAPPTTEPPPKAAAPSPSRKPPSAAGGKKMSVAEPVAPQIVSPSAPQPVVEPIVVSAPAPLSADERAAAIQTLGRELARRCAISVMDALPFADSQIAFDEHAINRTAIIADKEQSSASASLETPVSITTVAGPALRRQLSQWAVTLQQQLPVEPQLVTAIVGGKSLQTKLRLIDGLLEVADVIFFVGEIATSLYRILGCQLDQKKQQEGSNTIEGKPAATGIATMWSVLAPAIKKLRQKASRKNVQLLLPADFFVGETSLEEQDTSVANVASDEEEEEDEEDEEEEEEDDGDVDESSGKSPKKSKKAMRRKKRLLKKRQQAMVLAEPSDSTRFGRRQFAYEGEKAHVMLATESTVVGPSGSVALPTAWRSFNEVSEGLIASASVVSGPTNILTIPSGDDGDGNEDEDDEEDEEDGHAYQAKKIAARIAMEAAAVAPPSDQAHDWTFRAFDIGPVSTQLLVEHLRLQSTTPHTIIVSGLSGVAEFDVFSGSARQLVATLSELEANQSAPVSLLIAGQTTAEWFQWLELPVVTSSKTTTNGPSSSRLVDSRVLRSAPVLKELLASKSHPIIAQLVEATDNI